MMGYGFGYDEELPAGFQDADLEMREWEERVAEKRESESDWETFAKRCVATAETEVYA